MSPEPNSPQDEAELHAYVDGRLDPRRRAAVQARLEADAEAAQLVRAWAQQRDALRALHSGLLQEPAPAPLQHAAQQLHSRSSRLAQWQRWGGMAAAVLVAFGLGWAGHAHWGQPQQLATANAPRTVQAFAQQAVLAHAVYAPEVRHPVEVDAGQQQHLVQWLSKRLDRPLKIPNLGAQGYELVGGRLLPGDQGARAQFMYQDAQGERITLYVGAVPAESTPQASETAFRYTSTGGFASFYWVDQGFGYALAGKLPRAGLLTLAEAVYRQL